MALLITPGGSGSVITVGSHSFQKQHVEELVLGGLSGVASIGTCFLHGCAGLNGVVDMGTITANSFLNTYRCFVNSGNGPIQVPAGQEQACRDKFGGNTSASRFIE